LTKRRFFLPKCLLLMLLMLLVLMVFTSSSDVRRETELRFRPWPPLTIPFVFCEPVKKIEKLNCFSTCLKSISNVIICIRHLYFYRKDRLNHSVSLSLSSMSNMQECLSYSGEETHNQRCVKVTPSSKGVSNVEWNKHQLLLRIASIWTTQIYLIFKIFTYIKVISNK